MVKVIWTENTETRKYRTEQLGKTLLETIRESNIDDQPHCKRRLTAENILDDA